MTMMTMTDEQAHTHLYRLVYGEPHIVLAGDAAQVRRKQPRGSDAIVVPVFKDLARQIKRGKVKPRNE